MEVRAIRIQTQEHDYKKDHIALAMKEQALAANSQKPTSERRLLFIIVFL